MAGKQKGEKGNKKKFSLTVWLIIGSVLLIVAVALGLLYPKYRRIRNINEAWVKQSIRLEEQKRFFPVYAAAQVLADQAFEAALPFPERQAISRGQVSGLSQVFNDIARKHGVILSENRLDTESFNIGASMIALDLTFKGELTRFRPCLIDIAGLPCFKIVENMEITTNQENIRQCNIRVQVAIADNHSN